MKLPNIITMVYENYNKSKKILTVKFDKYANWKKQAKLLQRRKMLNCLKIFWIDYDPEYDDWEYRFTNLQKVIVLGAPIYIPVIIGLILSIIYFFT